MPRILVVEDEILIRELVVEELEDAGFEVEGLPDGEKALALLQSGARFDLVFTDIRMPGAVDGWQLGRNAQDLFPDLPIVYVTGYSEGAHALRKNEGFLNKPYRTRDVLALIKGFGITS